jgi:hypothetical protein
MAGALTFDVNLVKYMEASGVIPPKIDRLIP